MKTVTPQNLATYIYTLTPKNTSRPIAITTAELDSIHNVIQKHIDDFTHRGLTVDFLKLAAPTSNLLAEAEHAWLAGRFDHPEAIKMWKKSSVEGFLLHDDFQKDLELALEDSDEAMRSLKLLRENSGPENMLNDLAAQVTIARKYLHIVTAGGISEARIDEIEQYCDELRTLFAQANSVPESKQELKLKRDQIRTFAVEYLATIRRYANRIYKDDEQTRLLFTSKYDAENNRAHYLKQKAKKEAEKAIKVAEKAAESQI